MANLIYIHEDAIQRIERETGIRANVRIKSVSTLRDELVICLHSNDTPLVRVILDTHDKWELLTNLLHRKE